MVLKYRVQQPIPSHWVRHIHHHCSSRRSLDIVKRSSDCCRTATDGFQINVGPRPAGIIVQEIRDEGMLRRDVGTRHVRAADGQAAEQLISPHRDTSHFRKGRSAYHQAEVHQVADEVDFEAYMSPERRVDLLVNQRARPGPYRLAGRPHAIGGFRFAAGTGVRIQHDHIRRIESIQPVRTVRHGHGEAPFREGDRHVVSAGEVVGEHVHGRSHGGAFRTHRRRGRPALRSLPRRARPARRGLPVQP